MKILYITNEIPYPPNNGVRIVSYNAIRMMHDKGHEVCLCTLTSEQDESDDNLTERYDSMSELISQKSFWFHVPKRTRSKQILDTLIGKLTYLQQYKIKEFEIKLRNIFMDYQPDVVHYDGISLTQYIYCLPPGVGSVASINDCHTLTLYNNLKSGIFTGVTKSLKKLQLKRTKRYEATMYPLFDYVHLMTDIDAKYLRKMNSEIKTWVISNGVDSELFSVNHVDIMNSDIVFVGALTGNNYYSLKRFIEDGWPIIKDHASCPTLTIIGKISEEAEHWVADLAETENRIKFLGYISKLAKAYENKAIAVVPINKNSGLINKAIEAMAARVALVGFSSTFEAMPYAEKDKHYLSGNTYIEIGKCIIDLLDNMDTRMAIANAGRKLAHDHHSWPSKADEYEAMYLSAASIARL